METSLHRALKEHYGSTSGGRTEVSLRGFRIDAVDAEGRLIEIQSGPLSPLRAKLDRLLPEHSIKVVKPVFLERRVVRRKRPDGRDLSCRRSPKRGELIDVFEDLVGLARAFPDPNLTIEVLGVSIDEIRIPRRRWPGYKVVDRRLAEIQRVHVLRNAADLWELLPAANWHEPFTTVEIARHSAKPIWLAQRVAYCLRLTGAARVLGKRGNCWLYQRQGCPADISAYPREASPAVVGT